jgi:hypothetical protein
MTDMPTTTELREALADWAAATDTERVPRLLGSARRMALILERVTKAQEEADERSARRGETYTAAGLPRRAAMRARDQGAVITPEPDAFRVTFPNGSYLYALTRAGADTLNSRGSRVAFVGRVVMARDGAAPGCTCPGKIGDLLEDVLNAFADEREARATKRVKR